MGYDAEKGRIASKKYAQSEKGKIKKRLYARKYRKQYKEEQTELGYRAAIVDYLINKDGFLCGFCGKSLENSKIHIDHIIPKALGGPNTISNMRLSHAYCNLSAGHKIRRIKNI